MTKVFIVTVKSEDEISVAIASDFTQAKDLALNTLKGYCEEFEFAEWMNLKQSLMALEQAYADDRIEFDIDYMYNRETKWLLITSDDFFSIDISQVDIDGGFKYIF